MRSSRPRMCGFGTHPGAAHVHGSRMMMSYDLASAVSNARSDVFTSSATPSSLKARSRQRRISTSPDAPPRRLSSSYALIESIVYKSAFLARAAAASRGGGGCVVPAAKASTGGEADAVVEATGNGGGGGGGGWRAVAGVAGGCLCGSGSGSGSGGGGGSAAFPCARLQRCKRICFSSWFNAVSVSFINAKWRRSIRADTSTSCCSSEPDRIVYTS